MVIIRSLVVDSSPTILTITNISTIATTITITLKTPDVDQMTLGMVWLPNWLRSNSPGKKMSSRKSPKSAYSGT